MYNKQQDGCYQIVAVKRLFDMFFGYEMFTTNGHNVVACGCYKNHSCGVSRYNEQIWK